VGLDTKTYWLTDRQSQCDFDFDFDFEKEVGGGNGRLYIWEGGQEVTSLSAPTAHETPFLYCVCNSSYADDLFIVP
jgi:hypothetical protein